MNASPGYIIHTVWMVQPAAVICGQSKGREPKLNGLLLCISCRHPCIMLRIDSLHRFTRFCNKGHI